MSVISVEQLQKEDAQRAKENAPKEAINPVKELEKRVTALEEIIANAKKKKEDKKAAPLVNKAPEEPKK